MEIQTSAEHYELEKLQIQNVRWFIYGIRALFVLFLLSWTCEVVRMGLDDYRNVQIKIQNPPENCFPAEKTWAQTIATPFTWTYNALFVPPIKNNCEEYLRLIHPSQVFLPRFPEALATTLTNFILVPFEVFLDKFGDALRRFMDKFSLTERLFGIIVLIVMMIIPTILAAILLTRPRTLVQTVPLLESPSSVEQGVKQKRVLRIKD
jgi:hypothetical protein